MASPDLGLLMNRVHTELGHARNMHVFEACPRKQSVPMTAGGEYCASLQLCGPRSFGPLQHRELKVRENESAEYGRTATPGSRFRPRAVGVRTISYLVDPASSHMLVSKIKPCKCKYELEYSETANGSLNQLWFI